MRFMMFAFAPLVALAACTPTMTNIASAPDFGPVATRPAEPSEPWVAAAPPTPNKRVVVLKGSDVNQPIEIIGLIDVHAEMKDQDRALEALKAKAGGIGADAVIDVEYHHAEANEPSHLSGTAVRFNDLLKGRAYETIGPVEATFEMGEEEEGLRALKAKARAMGGQFILGLKFEHGEGSEKPKVFGAAVRLK